MELKASNKLLLSHRNNQSGVVLIVALVFLIALTAVAAALMQNTTTDIKMAGASQEKAIAIQATISEMDLVMFNAVNRVFPNAGGNLINIFGQDVNAFGAALILPVTDGAITDAYINVANEFQLETKCPRSERGSDEQAFSCNILRVTVNRTYGRNNNSRIIINSGVAQYLIPKGG